MWTNLKVYFFYMGLIQMLLIIILKNKKLISFYKFSFQCIAVVQDISPSSGSVKVIFTILRNCYGDLQI